MSRRFNKYGFSLSRMRRLFASQDEAAVQHIRDDIAARYSHLPEAAQQSVFEVVERAIRSGVPFPELQTESWVHAAAAEGLGRYGQEWLMNYSSVLEDAYALEDGLGQRFRKYASPETKAFLRGLLEGIPMFGTTPAQDGSNYGAISLERMRIFAPGFADYAEVLAHRVGRRKSAPELDRNAAEFAREFSAWLNELVARERDLFFSFG